MVGFKGLCVGFHVPYTLPDVQDVKEKQLEIGDGHTERHSATHVSSITQSGTSLFILNHQRSRSREWLGNRSS
jgi:hypothetical protein